jgi:hypothetical protein
MAVSSYRPVTDQLAAGRNACSHRADISAEKESAHEAQPADGTLTAGFFWDLGTPIQGN